MTFKSALAALGFVALTATGATAQETALAAGTQNAVDPTVASPFAFAESHKKAEAAEAARVAAAAGGGKVIGGTISANGAWPWQVGLMIAGQPVSPDAHFCGGSMVLDTWVLTAAHCVHMEGNDGVYRDLPPQAINILVGTNTIAPGQGDLVPVQAIFRHPSYVGTEFDNDIALIKLARAPQAQYQTIKVPDAEFGDYLDQPGVTTVVTGWGLVNGGGHPSDLHEAQIQMLDRDQCNGAMIEARAEAAVKPFIAAAQTFGLGQNDAEEVWNVLVSRAPLPMTSNMLCSGTYEGGKTSCQGDSGGPLVVPLDDGSYIQAGVVSWGLAGGPNKTCVETALFSAYTRVSNYIGWMNQVVNQN
ncbi:MAG: serine protease [Brevirhabdus sp.]